MLAAESWVDRTGMWLTSPEGLKYLFLFGEGVRKSSLSQPRGQRTNKFFTENIRPVGASYRGTYVDIRHHHHGDGDAKAHAGVDEQGHPERPKRRITTDVPRSENPKAMVFDTCQRGIRAPAMTRKVDAHRSNRTAR